MILLQLLFFEKRFGIHKKIKNHRGIFYFCRFFAVFCNFGKRRKKSDFHKKITKRFEKTQNI